MTRNSGVSTAPMASGPKTRMPSTKPRMLRSHQRSSVSLFIRFLICPNGSFVTQRQKQIIAGVNQFNGAVLRAGQITRRAGRRAALGGDVNVAAIDRCRELAAVGGRSDVRPRDGGRSCQLHPGRAGVGGGKNVA